MPSNTTRRAPLLAFLLLACGGRVDDLTPGTSATVTPTSTSTPPSNPPPSTDDDCGGMDAIVYESSAHLLSRFDRKTTTATAIGTASCSFDIDALAVRHDGNIVVMASSGKMAVIDRALHCNESVPPASFDAGLYRGLAIVDQTLFTLRLGPTSDYVQDGAYHHRLIEIGPKGGGPISTHDTKSYPSFLAATSSSAALVVGLSSRTVDTWHASANDSNPTSIAELADAREGALIAHRTLFFLGDLKDAHPSKRVALPTYELDLDTSGWTRGKDVTMPGGGFSDVRVGMTACAAQR